MRALSIICLVFLHMFAISTYGAKLNGETRATEMSQSNRKQSPALQYQPTAIDVNSQLELENLLLMVDKIQQHKLLYNYLNEQFSNMLMIPENLQKTYGWPEKSKGLSSTQMVFLLNKLPPTFLQLLNQYLKSVNDNNIKNPTIIKLRKELKKKFQALLNSENIKNMFLNMNDPTEPLVVKIKKEINGYDEMKLYVNHPSIYKDSTGNEILKNGDNLKQVVLDFINEAKSSIQYNVFEFNLMDVALALAAKNKQGVSVLGGIDKTTTENDETNKQVFKYLSSLESKNFKTIPVESVGLNHQKIIVRDAGTPNAAVLYLSGNFTQSCIGPEGDAVNLPIAQRPVQSKPNANHALLVKGQLPALITKHELEKTLIKKLRGQSEYPISGSYLVFGPQQESGARPSMLIAFSPNGGMGEVNRDLIKRIILGTKGSIKAMHFAFSSQDLEQAILKRFQDDKNSGKLLNFQAAGDPPFAMRDWSVFLHLSGFKVNPDTQMYELDSNSPLVQNLSGDELKQWQDKIRIDPKTFGEFQSNIQGQTEKVSVKLHHKVFIFPEDKISIVGTSFNPSNNAESNQEQLIVVNDPDITHQIEGAFEYLYQSSKITVADRVKFKNSYSAKTTEFELRTIKLNCSKVFSLL